MGYSTGIIHVFPELEKSTQHNLEQDIQSTLLSIVFPTRQPSE